MICEMSHYSRVNSTMYVVFTLVDECSSLYGDEGNLIVMDGLG